MIYLLRTNDDGALSIAAVEDEARAARYEGYARVDYAAFRAAWKERDLRRGREMKVEEGRQSPPVETAPLMGPIVIGKYFRGKG